MIFFSELCKKDSPRAAPIAIFSRLSHESGSTAELPEHHNQHVKKLYHYKLDEQYYLASFISFQVLTSKKMVFQTSFLHKLVNK